MLNKRERSFLNTAVVYGWCIEIESWNGKAHWDGDYCLPVEPTPEMRDIWFFMEDLNTELAAMLNAAPALQEGE